MDLRRRGLHSTEHRRFQPDVVNARDQYAQVVCDDLAQNLVDLADLGLRPQVSPLWCRTKTYGE